MSICWYPPSVRGGRQRQRRKGGSPEGNTREEEEEEAGSRKPASKVEPNIKRRGPIPLLCTTRQVRRKGKRGKGQ